MPCKNKIFTGIAAVTQGSRVIIQIQQNCPKKDQNSSNNHTKKELQQKPEKITSYLPHFNAVNNNRTVGSEGHRGGGFAFTLKTMWFFKKKCQLSKIFSHTFCKCVEENLEFLRSLFYIIRRCATEN